MSPVCAYVQCVGLMFWLFVLERKSQLQEEAKTNKKNQFNNNIILKISLIIVHSNSAIITNRSKYLWINLMPCNIFNTGFVEFYFMQWTDLRVQLWSSFNVPNANLLVISTRDYISLFKENYHYSCQKL